LDDKMKKFETDLNNLVDQTASMGDLVTSLLDKSINALCEQNYSNANEVIEEYRKVDDFDNSIEEAALQILLLYQPTAIDMRIVATILKDITYMERIGKYSNNIAKAALYLKDREVVDHMEGIPEMGKIASEMVRMVTRAIKTRDISKFGELRSMDDKLDRYMLKIVDNNVAIMHEYPFTVDSCTYYISVSKYLERVGDHACKIAEKVTYMVTGERVNID